MPRAHAPKQDLVRIRAHASLLAWKRHVKLMTHRDVVELPDLLVRHQKATSNKTLASF
jgi:hypothetical protein